MSLNFAKLTPATLSASQNKQALRKVFQKIRANSCPLSYNFHLHSIFSDGQLKPEQIMAQAVSIGLQGFAITDHHSVAGYRVARQWLDRWIAQNSAQSHAPTPPQLWTGVEITCDLIGTNVHILGYAFNPEHPTLVPYLQGYDPTGVDSLAVNVIRAIQTAGGLAVLAHPVRYRRSPDELIRAAAEFGIDGVETYYAYRNPNPWQPSPKQARQVKQLAEKYDLLSTCGTDTHGENLLVRL